MIVCETIPSGHVNIGLTPAPERCQDNVVELSTLLTADYANVEQKGKLNVMGIFGQINSSAFPARHPEMHLVVSLVATPAEAGQTRQLTIRLMDEDGSSIFEWSKPIEVPAYQVPGSRIEVNAILQLRDMVFEKPGTYEFRVLVDNDDKGYRPLVVAEAIPAPEQG